MTQSEAFIVGYKAGSYNISGMSNSLFMDPENQASARALFDAQSKAYQEIEERYHSSLLSPLSSTHRGITVMDFGLIVAALLLIWARVALLIIHVLEEQHLTKLSKQVWISIITITAVAGSAFIVQLLYL